MFGTPLTTRLVLPLLAVLLPHVPGSWGGGTPAASPGAGTVGAGTAETHGTVAPSPDVRTDRPRSEDVRREGRRWDGRTRTVHEWGTFTHVQGSNGLGLEGLTHDPFGLPPFVYDLVDRLGLTGFSPKMETPVIYLYSPEPWHLFVRVDFPHGLLTQWFPAANRANLWGTMFRPPADLEARMHGAGELARGWLEWGRDGELLVLPPGDAGELPEVEPHDPWVHSREVGANTLRVTNDQRWWLEASLLGQEGDASLAGPPEVPYHEDERFLFYRGLGDFPMPLTVELGADRSLAQLYALDGVLHNERPSEPLRDLFLVRVEGERMGYRALGDLVERLELRDVVLELRPREEADEALANDLVAALEGTGLFADEARAMVNTWRSHWFGDPGLRLLYLVPGPLVERELPLSVEPVTRYGQGEDGRFVELPQDPAPEEVVRAFVGRLDLLPPSFERELLGVLDSLGSDDPARRAAAEAQVLGWGRYRAPYLERAAQLGADPALLGRAAGIGSDGPTAEDADVGAPVGEPAPPAADGSR